VSCEDSPQPNFPRIVREIELHLRSVVDRKWGPAADWQQAVLDVRASREGDRMISKFRITRLDGQVKPASTSSLLDNLLWDLWEARKFVFTEPWYGWKITIFPEAAAVTELNSDPRCIDDPTFFDD